MLFSGGPGPSSTSGPIPLLQYKTIRLPGFFGIQGQVTFTGASGAVVVPTNREGWFAARLPVGSYTAVGHSRFFQDGKLPCPGVQYAGLKGRAAIQVSAGGVAHVAVTCNGY